jgi:type IV pilus assembly protein PilA
MNSSPTQRREDKGFTLIELMVVVLIIAILLAIAIPTFLGAQNKAKDRSAQSSARNALTNAKTIFADTGIYSNVTVALLNNSEPSLTFVDGAATTPLASTTQKMVSMITTPTAWYGAVKSDTDTCFFIADSVGPTGAGTTYASAKVAASGTGTVTSCIASATPPGGYTDKW